MRWQRASWLIAVLSLIGAEQWPHPAAARSLDRAVIDATIRADMVADAPPGLAVAVRQGDKADPEVFVHGQADIEQARAISAASIFPVASITKTFTSIAILELQQAAKLSVDDTLNKFLPDFPNASAITLRELLVHTSGIADFTALPAFLQAQAKDWTPQEIVQLVAASPPVFPPGVRCAYNDSAYVILGLVIEKASGASYADFVRTHVSVPLGMTTATLGSNSRIVPHRVTGYAVDAGTLRNAPYTSLVSPFAAGGIAADVADVVRLGAVLHSGGALISPQSYAEMIAPVAVTGGTPCVQQLPSATSVYGYGLEIVTFDDLPKHRAIGKSGLFPGYSSYVARFENSPLTIAAMANLDGGLPFTVQLVHDVAKVLLHQSESTGKVH
jgi:D-alanyl-D-alanine carboxypeptidase